MNIVLFGPQGSGKGTQARLLCDKYGFFYFESGSYLRRIAENNPELKKSLADGKLVPDKEMTSYLTAFFDEKNLYDDIVFDGFPRTLEQYQFLKIWLAEKQVKIDLAIVLKINEDETLRRLSARRQDLKTGKIYNLVTDLPPADIDINSLIQRDDDKPDAIRERLSLYKSRTEVLINQMKNDTKVIEVDGERSIEDIQKDLVKIIKDVQN
jgi:adenylate kinase